jgi:hypothetical protein
MGNIFSYNKKPIINSKNNIVPVEQTITKEINIVSNKVIPPTSLIIILIRS